MSLLTGGSATWTTGASVLTVSTVDLSSVLANMTVSFVNTDGSVDGKAWRIQSVTPSGTSGGSITVYGTLPTYSSSTGIVVDTRAYNGTGTSLLLALVTNTINAIAAMLGAGFSADASSRVLEIAKATSGALSRILFKIGSTAQFMMEQVAVSSVEYLKIKRTADGSSWSDVIAINRDTGEITTTGSLKVSGGMTGALAPFRNRLINGDFRINQRVVSGTVTLSAGVYGHDRWRGGGSGGTYTSATSGGVTTLTITANTLRQTIEAANIDGTAFVLSWTGTATARVWQGSASGSYVASPIVVTGLTANTDTVIEFSTGTVSKAQFEPGAVATAFEFRPLAVELALCQRYYNKTYNLSVAPGTNTGVGIQYWAATTQAGQFSYAFKFPVPMRTTPTVTTYNTAGTAGKVDRAATSADSFAIYIGENSCSFGTNDTTTAAGITGHIVASAEF